MSAPKKPRPGGSRPSIGRPRKLAGQRPTDPPVVEEGAPAPVSETPSVVDEGALAPVSKPPEDAAADDGGFETGLRPSSTTGGDGGVETGTPSSSTTGGDASVVEEGALAPVSKPPEDAADGSGVETGTPSSSTADEPPRRTLTWVLVAAVALLALIGIAEVVYLARDPEPAVSAERPVVTGELSHRAAVEAAARATEEILSTTYTDYDNQVDQASSKMTDSFAEEYRETAEGIRDEFIEKRSKLQVKAVAQGVAQASPEQVQALLFLNQYVEKVEDGEPQTAFAQYRALVTVVRTDQGWLVSDIETK